MADVRQFIGEIHNIPNIPRVIQELIDSFNDEDIDVSDITDKIAMDQSLSLKILRMANSSYYGHSREVSSMTDAVMTLGFKTLKSLVLTTGVTGAFRNCVGFDIKGFWRQSFRTAALARELVIEQRKSQGKACLLDAETAFTCGLMHNLGEVLIHLHSPVSAKRIDELVDSGSDRVQLQLAEWGVSYPILGEELARNWRLPEVICMAIANQNDLLTGVQDADFLNKNVLLVISEYAQVLYVAKTLAENHDSRGIQTQFKNYLPEETSGELLGSIETLFQRLDISELSQSLDAMI
ncbi:MAG: HDOD domain-containing protein [Pseudomonadales bacterium]|nr:HDOD domain-containing protein [Pseudomonadales bacterium]